MSAFEGAEESEKSSAVRGDVGAAHSACVPVPGKLICGIMVAVCGGAV